MNRAVPRILRVITWFNTASAGRNLASSGWKAYPLNTVNAELQSKVPDLSRINNDMNNQLAGTGIGTIFVDHHFLILRFTPTVTKIINLIQSDVGRPVGHIVINTLIPKEVTIKTLVARSYTMRILPYRTLDNVIEGAVITFFDITEIAQTREALRQANELLRLAVWCARLGCHYEAGSGRSHHRLKPKRGAADRHGPGQRAGTHLCDRHERA